MINSVMETIQQNMSLKGFTFSASKEISQCICKSFKAGRGSKLNSESEGASCVTPVDANRIELTGNETDGKRVGISAAYLVDIVVRG